MPKRLFSLEGEKENRLAISWELSWRLSWKNIKISVDRNQIGFIYDQKSLISGQTFSLPDGSELKVQIIQNPSYSLNISRNGILLPDSDDNPHSIHKNTYITIYSIAVINIFLGSISLLFNRYFEERLEIKIAYICIGILFLILGYFIQRKYSTALIAAILFLSIESAVGFCLASMGLFKNLSYVAMQIVFLIPIIRGYYAMKKVKENEK
jgi:hypothetical protein